jgi:enediyne biosynthesis protein E4
MRQTHCADSIRQTVLNSLLQVCGKLRGVGIFILIGWLGMAPLAGHASSILDVIPDAYATTPAQGYSGALSQRIRSQQVYPAHEFPSAPIRITSLRWRRFSAQTFENAGGQFRFKLSTTSRNENTLSGTFAHNVGPDETVVFDGVWTVSSTTATGGAPYPFEIVLNLTTPFLYDPAQGNLLLEHQCFSTTIPTVDAAGDFGDGLARAYNLNLDPNATSASVVDTGGEIIQFEYTIVGPPIFSRVTSGVLVTDANDSLGAAWGDLNGDGWEDVFVGNFNQQNAIYLNNGNGSFTKVSAESPVLGSEATLAVSMADYNNDGALDLFVSNNGIDRLYRNNGNGTWAEQTTDPVQQDALISSGSAWGDYNDDGLLDLVIAMGGGGAPVQNRLYQNTGTGFARITSGTVAQSTGYNISASWADIDGDGDLDLLFTGDNLLFRNDGGGVFTQLTSTPISTVSGFPHGGAWADYDNDGDLDLLIVNFLESPKLYRNEGSGSFMAVSVPDFVGVTGIGLAWGDYDLDGFVDVAIARRDGESRVFRNNGEGGFVSLPMLGEAPASSANGVAWVDYDLDGDLDLFFARGGNTGSVNNQSNVLLNNAGNDNGWLVVKLNGGISNRQGVGAKVRITAQIAGEQRQQLRQVGGGDSYGGNPNLAHFGLGNATIIDELRVEWPSGYVTVLESVLPNQRLTISEIESTSALVIPAGLQGNDGNGYSGTLREPQLRLQAVYGAANFPAGNLTITELRFRRDIGEPPFSNASANVTVKLSTTSRGTGNLSATFAENSGADETTVFSGVWNYSSPTTVAPGTVRPFEIVLPLSAPFTYNPSAGNLLFDIRVAGGTGGGWTDGASGSGSQVARVLSLNPDAATGNAGELTGDVIQLVYQTTATIEILPNGGTFTNSVQVSMSSSVPGGVIRYTTNGNEPTGASTAYSTPFTLTETATVKARLFVNGFPASEIVEATYTRYVPPDIQFNPAGQLFTNQLSVTLVNHVGAGTIRYTTNGAEPTSASTAYAGPLNLTAGATIRARVFLNTFPVSAEFSETYLRVYAFGNDGVPFAWREQYFGPGFLTNPCAAVGADCDGDGYSVAEEYQYTTDPTDGGSAPEILLTVRVVPKLTFTTIPGRSYRIGRTTTLNPPDWQTIVESVLATGSELHYVDAEAPDNSYYRIELIQD